MCIYVNMSLNSTQNVADESCKDKQNRFNNFFRKSCLLRDNVEKYSIAGQAIDNNMTHVHCVLDT